jgi:nucleotide-binding universal stress UspA family protein
LAGQLLGDRVGLLTLAMVVDHDSADSERHNITAATDHAHRALERIADLVGGDAQTVVLTGRPAETLVQLGARRRPDRRRQPGRGLSRSMIGHVTSRLVRQNEIPVLVAGVTELRANVI